jgi:hypothetical protein
MKFTPMRLTVLGLCLVMLAATVPGLMQSPAVAGPRVMKPGDDGGGSSGSQQMLEDVLIQADKPYTNVIAAINAAGGSVSYTYKNFDGIAARIPRSAIRTIGALTGPERIAKDLVVPAPAPRERFASKDAGMVPVGDERQIAFESVNAIAAADLPGLVANNPEAYLFNNSSTNVDALLAGGITGNGIVVGVIDSGIRPGFFHIESDGSVIGCEDFVGDVYGCSHVANNGHGTFVAGMISANAIFGFNPAGRFFNAVASYLPSAIIPPNGIPMIGSAPLSSIYAFRVFPTSGGAPTSFILAAMDRAIELRELYEDGDPAGVNIGVVNMSLGGPTLNAGRDLFDTAVEAMAAADIVVVTSAGNAGPSGMTAGSPTSAYSSLAVGASSIAAYERIWADLYYGPGVGGLYRPSSHMQTAEFSSRGPNADGRLDPEISASGDWSYGQGFFGPGSISFAGGTSFSAPTVAGVAALLRQAHPGANAAQIHNAIAMTGNPALFGDNSTVHDRGSGYVDAAAADALLATGTVPTTLPTPPPFVKSVQNNIESNAGLTVVTGNHSSHIGPLEPGERGEVYYKVNPNTAQVIVTVSNFSAELPPGQQNPFFGDDIRFTVHQAKTSRQPGTSGYIFRGFILGGTLPISNPEPGIIRVTLTGDWTNAGAIEADVNVFSIADPLPGSTDQGKVAEGDNIEIPFTVPAGTSVAEFRLGWRQDWGSYPLNDIDLVLEDPLGNEIYSGATLNVPETAVIFNPMAGTWTAKVQGFELHTTDDKYDLRIVLDGSVVK